MKRTCLLLILPIIFGCSGGCRYSDDTSDLPASPFAGLEKENYFDMDAYRLSPDASVEQVVSLYRSALADGRQKGYTPVFVYSDELLHDHLEYQFSDGGREAFVHSVLDGELPDGKTVLDDRLKELRDLYGSYMPTIDTDTIDSYLGKFENTDMNLYYETDPIYRAYLVCVPTDKPYEVFSYLPFCGWNECPNVPEMIAIAKYWYEQYGVIPAAISHDTLQFYNEKPITDKAVASALAFEQFAFCSEVIASGGIEPYVSMNYDGTWWFFWWD